MIYTANKRPENIGSYKETADGKFEIEYLAEFDQEHREDLENALVHIGVPYTTDECEEDENGDWNEVEGVLYCSVGNDKQRAERNRASQGQRRLSQIRLDRGECPCP